HSYQMVLQASVAAPQAPRQLLAQPAAPQPHAEPVAPPHDVERSLHIGARIVELNHLVL
ncbi:hypothetical protein A2U01_0079392, partial [Trifolium medium]|nr:hypothetical protein [Trifolium medium]